MENPSYYVIIPANVRYDKRINVHAKLLYGEITALCNKEGYCWASNHYFSGLYEVSASAISRWIKSLADAGYLTIDYQYIKGKKAIAARIIRLIAPEITPLPQPEGRAPQQQGSAEMQRGSAPQQQGIAEMHEGYYQKRKDNNTYNTTSNNTFKKREALVVEKACEPQETGGCGSSLSLEKKPDQNNEVSLQAEKPVVEKTSEPQECGGYNVPLAFGYNAAQRDIMSRLNAIGKTWNNSGGLLPCRKSIFSPPEITNMLPTLQCYSDSQILEAIRNYAVIAKEPAAYCVKEDGTGITLVNFITRWVERFTDEAKPFEHYKKRNERSFGNRRYQTTPPPARNTDGADLLSKYCREI